jgi:pimeloyl-ACP methyl ester carboxylesterase
MGWRMDAPRSANALLAGCAVLALAVSGCMVGDEDMSLYGDPADDRADLASLALDHSGGSTQFGGGFAPGNAPYGGFGGGPCTASRTPIVFIHGNGDEAKNWDYPSATGVASVYDSFIAAGYRACELFGVNWLSASERDAPQYNYHKLSKAQMIQDFIWDVLDYTGAGQVDVVGHSLGVTAALHAVDQGRMWPKIRRFIGVSGGMRGLTACYSVGNANALAPTCGSQNYYDSNIFGFYPHGLYTWNPRMGEGGFRDYPSGKSTRFYSLRAGYNDQVLCSTAGYMTGCASSALFDSYSGVRAQLDVGHGSTAANLDYDLSDWTIFNAGGGDIDGVGHFRARNNTGKIQVNMLTTECTGTACCSGYGARCAL